MSRTIINSNIFHALICLSAAAMFSSFCMPRDFNDKIEWNQNRKLSWEDFKDIPDRGTSHVALTSYKIGMTYLLEEANEIEFIVTCEFLRRDSWVRPLGRNNYVLNHEQKHFDLAEIFTRKLRKALKETNFRGMKLREVDKIINQLYSDAWDGCSKSQREYDYETDHSIDKRAQAEWDTQITAELSRLDDFSSKRVKVRK